MENNFVPYSSPQADNPLKQLTENEEIRRDHLNTEVNIKAAGVVFLIWALFILVAGPRVLCSDGASDLPRGVFYVLMLLGSAHIVIGVAAFQLRRWARIPGIVLASIGLLNFPIGFFINLVIIIAFARKTGRTVMTDEYRDIIRQTPHLNRKIPWLILDLITIAVLIFLMAWAGAWVMFSLGK